MDKFSEAISGSSVWERSDEQSQAVVFVVEENCVE